MSKRKMLITDLDGTLKSHGQPISESNARALAGLGQHAVVRAIATGRSLYAAKRVIPEDFPLDYLIFSCGAGIVEWPTGRLLSNHELSPADIPKIFGVLHGLGLDFMIHEIIPDNHEFVFFGSAENNPDFGRRCERNSEFAKRGDREALPARASQFIAVVPAESGPEIFSTVQGMLSECNVVRSTSPLDQSSIWIEVLPKAASKSSGGRWLANRYQIPTENVLALGNDYNDLDLLRWAGHGWLISSAPDELKSFFTVVDTVPETIIETAVSRWR